jgi:hypothetical protein
MRKAELVEDYYRLPLLEQDLIFRAQSWIIRSLEPSTMTEKNHQRLQAEQQLGRNCCPRGGGLRGPSVLEDLIVPLNRPA